MATKLQEGSKVRIKTRPVTPDDRKSNRYFEHMQGLEGVVTAVYSEEEVALEIRKETVNNVCTEVHNEAVRRLRVKFKEGSSEESRSHLTPEELNFDAHYILLARADDLEAI